MIAVFNFFTDSYCALDRDETIMYMNEFLDQNSYGLRTFDYTFPYTHLFLPREDATMFELKEHGEALCEFLEKKSEQKIENLFNERYGDSV